jgi:FtsP/CotA-like multicopper oxidase with cupredoxin domain
MNTKATLAVTATASAIAAAGLTWALGPSAQTPTRTVPTAQRVDLGEVWGHAFQDRATAHESLPRAEADANLRPAGAVVDRATNTIRFRTLTAAMTVVANLPNARDMAFRIGGLENPTIEIRRGTLVKIRFVNGDSDSAHGWLLLDPIVQIGAVVHGPRAFAGAYASILGDPGPTGQPTETIAFRASRDGTYRYECPVPGHAAMGMQGALAVIG